MPQQVDYEWRLRVLLAERGIFSSKQLTPLLAEHGVGLSDSQAWRLVTGRPERLNLRVLMVLCEILDCTPNDLIIRVETQTRARLERRTAVSAGGQDIVPKPARIRPARGRRDG